MNWDEEYRRLAQEMKALEAKMVACATLNTELVEVLEEMLQHDPASPAAIKARAVIAKIRLR